MPDPLDLHRRLIAAFDMPGIDIGATWVRLFRQGEAVPPALLDHHPDAETVTSCQAARYAAGGEPVLLTLANVGCVAAAICLGLVDQHQAEPLDGRRTYTCVMREQAGMDEERFVPPSPKEFTEGLAYACRDAARPDFCLFGPDDSGRFRDVATAKRAVAQMTAVQPPTTQAVFFCPPDFQSPAITPDVVILAVRPVELARLVQGWAWLTGERVESSMGPVRAVGSDLIARPLVTGRINVSTYCLGARLLANYGPGRMAMGVPWALFETLVRGMEMSRTGYPYPRYPGASPAGNAE